MAKRVAKKMAPGISEAIIKLCVVVLFATNTSVFEKMIIDK